MRKSLGGWYGGEEAVIATVEISFSFSQGVKMSDTIKQLLEEYGIKDEPKIREELGHGAYAVVKKVRSIQTMYYSQELL